MELYKVQVLISEVKSVQISEKMYADHICWSKNLDYEISKCQS